MAKSTHARPSPIDLDRHPEASLFSREEHPSLTRVLLAGLEAFAELGYHGTATRDITRRAGISAGGLYTHFESKQAILQTISRSTHMAMHNRMLESANESGTADERLRRIVTSHAEFHAQYPTSTRVANYELHSLQPAARVEMQRYRRGMEDIVVEILAEGQKSAEFDVPDVPIFGKFILSSGIDISRWFRPGGRLSPSQLGELHGESVLRAVRAKPPKRVAPKKIAVAVRSSGGNSRGARPDGRSGT